eukprot:COSAG01_NODE_5382_length_4295_cov_3.097235_6_plen_80_part_00
MKSSCSHEKCDMVGAGGGTRREGSNAAVYLVDGLVTMLLLLHTATSGRRAHPAAGGLLLRGKHQRLAAMWRHVTPTPQC